MDRQTDGNGYEHKGLTHEGGETHERERLKRVTDGAYEPGELGYKPQHDHNEVNGYAHPDHHSSQAPSAARDDRNPHASTTPYPTLYASHHAPSDTQTHLSTPIPPLPPLHLALTCTTSPAWNQPGHVTMSNHAQHASAFNSDERELALVNGTMPRPVPHIVWPTRTWPNVPPALPTTADYNGMPQYIPCSRPLRPQPRRPRYKRTCAQRKCIPSIPIPTLLISTPFATCLDTGSTLAAARAPATSFATGKSGSENTVHQSEHHNNITPYSIIRSRPPPWPIKYLDRNRNQHQHNGRITLAKETMRQRPPPWPNQSPEPYHHHHVAVHPITFIPPARPPPWPILSPNSIRNHRNVRHRLGQRS